MLKKIIKTGSFLFVSMFSTALIAAEKENLTNPSPDLALIFRAVNFLILIVGLYFLLKKPIKEFFSSRSVSLKFAVDEARQAHELALKSYEEIERKLKGCEQETKALLQTFREEGMLEKERILEQARAFSERIKSDAQNIANSELKKAKEELKEMSITLSKDLATKMIQKELDEGDGDHINQGYVERLRKLH